MILSLAAVVLIVDYPGNGLAGAIAVFAGVVGAALSSGVVWKGHPLLVGFGYWGRVGFVFRNSRLLREQAAGWAKPAEREQASE